MTHVHRVLCVLFLMSIFGFSAMAEETTSTRRDPLYAVVLNEDAADHGPDYEALGGKVERRWKHRAFVALPQAAVDALLRDPRVKFIQRVYTGDPLPEVPLQPRKQEEREVRTEWAAPTWFSGYYNYDGAGNIKSIDRQGVVGTDGQIDRYAYDLAGRLLYGTVNGPSNHEDYKYDSFGNLVRVQSSARPTMLAPASLSTNRLEGAGYDPGGNLTTPAGTNEKYIYDSFNMLRAKARPNVGGNVELYLYTADDERVAVDTLGITTWMIRDLGGKVLREWHGWGAPDAWVWEQDYIYRDGQLVAAERESVEGGTRHFHLDHLGTPRLITNQLGQKTATHDYFPFGVELTDFRQEMTDRGLPRPEPMKFTGHERDFTGGTIANHLDYIDYMHGRYYDPIRGRFLSVDPGADSALQKPQSWNRYAYARNNPLAFFDPDGLAVKSFKLIASGINNVPIKNAPAELGMQVTFNGFYLNFNLGIEFDAGDDLSDYTVERDAFVAGRNEFRDRKKEDPDDPGQIARTDQNMFVFDGPGLNVTNAEGGRMPRSHLGSGKFISLYEVRVVDKNTKQYDPKRYYYAIAIVYVNGQPTRTEIGEITEEQYRKYVDERKKEKPHRK